MPECRFLIRGRDDIEGDGRVVECRDREAGTHHGDTRPDRQIIKARWPFDPETRVRDGQNARRGLDDPREHAQSVAEVLRVLQSDRAKMYRRSPRFIVVY